MKKINVLSLFDGISCARAALERSGFKINKYYASEIDKYAIEISKHNWPDIIQLGSVTNIKASDFDEPIDLIIGGSPCQDLSSAGKGAGLDGERSGLFFEFVRLVKELKPKYFILENVASMTKENRNKMSKIMGVQPWMIDAALVSAQSRKRYFWTNIKINSLPENKGIFLKDILENGAKTDRLKSYCIDKNYYKGASWEQYRKKGRRQLVLAPWGAATKSKVIHRLGPGQGREIYDDEKKSPPLTVSHAKDVKIVKEETTNNKKKRFYIKKLTPVECERLQGLPDNYTLSKHPVYKNKKMSNTRRYMALGNAFNVDVICHILSFWKD